MRVQNHSDNTEVNAPLWDKLIKPCLLWDEVDATERSTHTFETEFKNHIKEYSGHKNVESFWNNWKNPIKKCLYDGATVQRVMFLPNITELDINNLLKTDTPWTLHNLTKGNDDLIEYLKGEAQDMGKANHETKTYIVEAHCPPENIHLGHVPIPNEHSELEVNISKPQKLGLAIIYEKKGTSCEKVAVLNTTTNKITLRKTPEEQNCELKM